MLYEACESVDRVRCDGDAGAAHHFHGRRHQVRVGLHQHLDVWRRAACRADENRAIPGQGAGNESPLSGWTVRGRQ